MNDSGLRSTMLALALCNFMVSFMVSGVGAILPAMGGALHASAADLSLISGIYVLALVIFNVVAAQLIVKFGQRRVFLGGFALFLIMCGSLALAPNMLSVWTQRFAQGAGAAMVATTSVTLLLTLAPRAMQGRFMGILTAATYVGIALGPLVGGGIATMFGWRWLFVVLLPLGGLAWLIMFRKIRTPWHSSPSQLDYPGIAIMAAAFFLLTVGASSIGRSQWATPLLCAGAAGLVLFGLVECRMKNPVVNVRFIAAHPPLILGLFAAFVNFGATNGSLYYFMFYLQQLRFLSPFQAGAFVALQSVTQSLLAPLAGSLTDRFGPDPVAAGGLGFCGAGILMSSHLSMDTPLLYVALCQCVIGIGLALFAGPNTLSIVRSVDRTRTAEASGLANTLRTMGMLCGLIIVSATMTRFLGAEGVSPAVADRFLAGQRFDLILFGSFNILGLVLVALRILNTYRCGLGKGVDCVPDESFLDDDEDDDEPAPSGEPGSGTQDPEASRDRGR
ncbi:MAG: MFS transporter [Desulfovibrionaceae bacterium]|nr:MFS transporter [Desulfovibrionaceae bacterium]